MLIRAAITTSTLIASPRGKDPAITPGPLRCLCSTKWHMRVTGSQLPSQLILPANTHVCSQVFTLFPAPVSKQKESSPAPALNSYSIATFDPQLDLRA